MKDKKQRAVEIAQRELPNQISKRPSYMLCESKLCGKSLSKHGTEMVTVMVVGGGCFGTVVDDRSSGGVSGSAGGGRVVQVKARGSFLLIVLGWPWRGWFC